MPPAATQDAVSQALLLLNAIDIVKGTVAEEKKVEPVTTGYLPSTDVKDEQPQKYHYETTNAS